METGISHTSEMVVTEDKLALNVGSGDLRVLGTPAMMALMENAAMLTVAPHLAEGDTTVGGHISSSHLRPTACGHKVTATATLTAIEGRKLTFKITAQDENGVIGEAEHLRFIVNREKFMGKL